jgi:hypothetical protein
MRYTQKPKDVYYTPEGLARELIELVPLKEYDEVIDASAGKDVFYNNYPLYVVRSRAEIEDGIDFFSINRCFDWSVTNPPFSKIDDFLKHSLKICRKGFAYVLPVHAITTRRLEYIENAGFGLTHVKLFKVKEWFGISSFCIFEKGKKSIIDYTRKIHHAPSGRIRKTNIKEK